MSALDLSERELKDAALRAGAIDYLQELLADFDTANIPDDGSYTYDDEHGIAERHLLDGNGPTVWAVFVQFGDDDDDVEGYLEYTETTTTMVHIPSAVAIELRSMLRRDSKARNAR
jgi:hypothetical protein